ncbi:hypothetical protein PO883_26915 [Massilia sp. DJPM01]|uniref:hypothetical protein n=1 Tax=Massilia sp. DJPM01 TaxID=3024404 RepID=UPI00259DB899|nr:hypothetical protein [Massilia sp. DJPM01]MDM5180818.1 hypothetical protein [Massilia sp. DJPM01]
MAAWQFAFVVIPVAGIIRAHGRMVEVLPEYAARVDDASVDADQVFPNYWEGFDNTAMQVVAASVLPVATSWCDEAAMYGNSETDDIEIWEDSVRVRLDCGNLNFALLAAVLNAVRAANCCVVLCAGGRIISPVLQLVTDALHASAATRFVNDPGGFVDARGAQLQGRFLSVLNRLGACIPVDLTAHATHHESRALPKNQISQRRLQ